MRSREQSRKKTPRDNFLSKMKTTRIVRVSFLSVLGCFLFVLHCCQSNFELEDVDSTLILSSIHAQKIMAEPASMSEADLIKIMTNETCEESKKGKKGWKMLCKTKLIHTAASLLQRDEDPVIVQVGAHIAFENNDPIANGMKSLIESSTTHLSIPRDRFHWIFVEPSPPNYAKLNENIEKNRDTCDMHSIQAAIVSEEQKGQDMIFYSISDDIDPETGYDSRSGRMLPEFITQVSSLNKESALMNAFIFEKYRLNMEDYIVETKVPLKTLNELMEEVDEIIGNEDTSGPLMLLIDAESNDCDIILGMSQGSKPLPHYIMFERKCHDDEKEDRAIEHLGSLGYEVITGFITKRWKISDHIAVRKDVLK